MCLHEANGRWRDISMMSMQFMPREVFSICGQEKGRGGTRFLHVTLGREDMCFLGCGPYIILIPIFVHSL